MPARGGRAHASAQRSNTESQRRKPCAPARTAAARPQIHDISRGNAKAGTRRGVHSPNYNVPVTRTDGPFEKDHRRGLLLCAQADESPAAVLQPPAHQCTLCFLVRLLLVPRATPHNYFLGSVSTAHKAAAEGKAGVKPRVEASMAQCTFAAGAQVCSPSACLFSVNRFSMLCGLSPTYAHSPGWFGVQGVPVDKPRDKLCSS